MKISHLGAFVLLAIICPAIAAEPAARPTQVLLLPFSPVNQAEAWIGQAVQQNLLNELGRTTLISPFTPPSPPEPAVADIAAAQKAARNTDASYVVFGSYHVAEVGVRFTGQVLEVNTGRLVGSARATGPMRDLFALEDELAAQVRKVLIDLHPRPTPQQPFVPVVAESVASIAGGLQPGARIAGPLLDHRQPAEAFDWRPVRDLEINTYTYYYSYYAPRTYLLSPPVYYYAPARRFHSCYGFGFSGAYLGNKGFVRFHGGK